MKNTAVLLLSTPMHLARKGAVAAVSEFLIKHNGSVLHSDDHLDSVRDLFLSRLEWDMDGLDIPISDFERHFNPLAERFLINYHLALTDYRPKMVHPVNSIRARSTGVAACFCRCRSIQSVLPDTISVS